MRLQIKILITLFVFCIVYQGYSTPYNLHVIDTGVYFPRINNNGEIIYIKSNKIYSTTRGWLTTSSQNLRFPDLNDSGEVAYCDLVAGHSGLSIVSTVTGFIGTGNGPQINQLGEVVYENVYSGQVFSSKKGLVDEGTQPHINDLGEIVYYKNGQVFSSTRGPIDAGSQPHINNSGEIVYKKSGQIFSTERGRITSGSYPLINDSGEVFYYANDESGFLQIYSTEVGQITYDDMFPEPRLIGPFEENTPFGTYHIDLLTSMDVNNDGDIVFMQRTATGPYLEWDPFYMEMIVTYTSNIKTYLAERFNYAHSQTNGMAYFRIVGEYDSTITDFDPSAGILKWSNSVAGVTNKIQRAYSLTGSNGWVTIKEVFSSTNTTSTDLSRP